MEAAEEPVAAPPVAPGAEPASPASEEPKAVDAEKRASASARPSASTAPRPSQQAAAAPAAEASEPPRASVKEGPRPSAAARESVKEAPRASVKEAPAEAPRASVKEAPRPSATTKETPRESIKDAPRPSAAAKETPRESVKEAPRPSAAAKETPRESIKETPRVSVKEAPAEAPRASVKDVPRPSTTAKDTPRESVKETPRVSVKEAPAEAARASAGAKETPRESVKGSPQVSPRDSASRPPEPMEPSPRKESIQRLVPSIDRESAIQKLAAFKGARMKTHSPLMAQRASAPASIQDGIPSLTDLYPGDRPAAQPAIVEETKPPVEREDTSHLPPLPPGWEEYYNDEGDAYYYCEATGETTWDRPAPLPEKPPAPPAAATAAGAGTGAGAAAGTPAKEKGPLKFNRNGCPPDEADDARDASPSSDKNVTPTGMRRWGNPGAKVAELSQVRGEIKNAAAAPKQNATTVTALMQNLNYDEIEKIQGTMPNLMRDKFLDKLTKDNEQIKRDFDTKKVTLANARKEVEKWTMVRDHANADILEMEERYNKNMDQILAICDKDNLEYPEQVDVNFAEAECVPKE